MNCHKIIAMDNCPMEKFIPKLEDEDFYVMGHKLEVFGFCAHNDLYKQLFLKKEHPVNFFFLTVVLIVPLHFVAGPVLEAFQIPANAIINVFLGILLQAVPFLLIGVLLSSAIQAFIPQSAIERRFPKSIGLGMLAAIIGGFCLPVCDCASIPIFISLVIKGIPLPIAVTFMTATPVINPVVILSTYYAFSGNMTIVIGRVCFGIIAAVIIGLTFAVRPPKGHVLPEVLLNINPKVPERELIGKICFDFGLIAAI